MMRLVLVLFSLLTLACAQTKGQPNDNMTMQEIKGLTFPTCPFEGEFESDLIGQDVSVLEDAELPTGVRLIHKNEMITQDYSENRLNIWVDENHRLEKLICG